ncbi:MAG TPA: hypothetical protein VGM16_12790, partial [Gammaproteobacteria bacterium]
IAFTHGKMHGFPIETVMSVLQQLQPRVPRTGFIFHSSFCCSSLLARSLQRDGRVLALREPLALRRLGDVKRSLAAHGQQWEPQGPLLLDVVLQLLSKTWNESEAVLIKPTHVANNLAADMLALRREAHGIVLHSDLEAFLVSNLKKQDDTQQKMPMLARIFDADTGYTRRFDNTSIESLGMLQQAAVIWHAQRLAFQALLASPAGARLRTLDSAQLLADPAAALQAAAGFLGEPLAAEELTGILEGPTWKTHAKDPFSDYDRATREQENRDIAAKHSDQIRYVQRWLEPLLKQAPPELSQPLLP